MQAVLSTSAAFEGDTEQTKISEANIKYHIARAFVIPPFAAPPHARNGVIVVQGEEAGYGKMKASEAGRLLRTLPHILDSVTGNEKTFSVLAFCRCDYAPYNTNAAVIQTMPT